MTSNTQTPTADADRLDREVMQHTPGPWRTRTLTDHDGPPACDDVQVQGVIDGVWQCIAQCEWSDDGKHAPTKPEALANARVIAAATVMENALRSLLLHAERMSEVMDAECDIRFRDDGPMDLARDALARAVGAAYRGVEPVTPATEATMSDDATPAKVRLTDGLGALLDDALSAYWDAAYAEGREKRTHDTEDGAAQTALAQVRVAVAALVAAERERCASGARSCATPSTLATLRSSATSSTKPTRPSARARSGPNDRVKRGDPVPRGDSA